MTAIHQCGGILERRLSHLGHHIQKFSVGKGNDAPPSTLGSIFNSSLSDEFSIKTEYGSGVCCQFSSLRSCLRVNNTANSKDRSYPIPVTIPEHFHHENKRVRSRLS